MRGIRRNLGKSDVLGVAFRVVAWTAVLVLATPGRAQDRAPGSINIYATALIEAANQMQKEWGNQQGSSSQTEPDYKHLLVAKGESVRADYPEMIDGRRFEYLTSAELLARRKTVAKDFPVLIVNPAVIDGGRIKVVVSLDWIGIEKGHLAFEISDWGSVFYRFDCEKGEFRFDAVKLGGI